jgi:glycosyltransferase involved in cell wall biosynthesis
MKNTFILMCTDYKPHLGGIAEWVYQVALSLCRAGWKVVVFAPKGTIESDEFDCQQPFETIRSIPMPGKGLLGKFISVIQHWPFVKSFGQVTRNREVAYILAADNGVYEGYFGFLRWAVIWLCHMPNGIVFHGQDVEVLPRMPLVKRRLFTFIIRGINDIFCNSQFTADTAKLGFCLSGSASPIVVGCGVCPENLPAPIQTNAARARLNITARYVILTAARLIPRKGVDMVIKALPEVLSHFPDMLYLVAGDGEDLPRLIELAKETGCTEYVRFDRPFDNRTEAHYYYCSADVFVMPARHIPQESVEGFGIVYVEAGFYGLPVIGGRAGGVPDAIVHGETGLLVNPEDPHEIAEALIRLLQDSTLRRRLGAAGRARVIEELRWENVTGPITKSF